MEYRILISGLIMLFAGLYLGYRDTRDHNFHVVEGVLSHVEARTEIFEGRYVDTTQYNLYMWLENIDTPFIFREFEKEKFERYRPSITPGKEASFTINRNTSLVWGINLNDAILLDPESKSEDEAIGKMLVALLGAFLLIVGLFFKKIRGIFTIGVKYS